MKGVGLFGPTARDQRTKEPDVDNLLDLESKFIKIRRKSTLVSEERLGSYIKRSL